MEQKEAGLKEKEAKKKKKRIALFKADLLFHPTENGKDAVQPNQPNDPEV